MTDTQDQSRTRVVVTEHGPYLVEGPVTLRSTEGEIVRQGGPCFLCRCGGSRHKPFCDATHGLKGFDGAETASHDAMADRRDDYPTGTGVTVHDDRSRCAHFGQCTDRLPAVFRAHDEPFVDPSGSAADTVVDVVAGCPSGALTWSHAEDPATVEPAADEEPSITPIVDGPYRLRGAIEVVGADGRAYERRARQTLCRCGQSRNKPFCDGSHWYAGFRDPLPVELAAHVPTLYEWVGGLEALERLTTRFYADIKTEPDPILEPVFRHMDDEHPRHVAAWLAETFGGPETYTHDHGGYHHMVGKHRGLGLTEEQRQAWIGRMARTADLVGLPDDPDFRAAFTGYLEWGTRIAVFNSQPDAEVMEYAPVPRWDWGPSAPYVPQVWDPSDAAERGRARATGAE